jgi:hypothetical protein
MSEISTLHEELKPLARVRSLTVKRQGTSTPGFTKDNAVIYDPYRQKLIKDWHRTVEGKAKTTFELHSYRSA